MTWGNTRRPYLELVRIESESLARVALEERAGAQPTSRVDSRLTCKVVTETGE